ncbi:hypothetical protein M2092_002425, partial [Fusobacterium sp. PH5-44]
FLQEFDDITNLLGLGTKSQKVPQALSTLTTAEQSEAEEK